MGEGRREALRVEFDRSVKVEFHGANVTSDAGLLAFRELDEALCLTGMVANLLVDTRTGLNTRHTLLAQFRQSVLIALVKRKSAHPSPPSFKRSNDHSFSAMAR